MKAESLDCPHCSASLSYLQPKTRTLACQSCGAVIEAASGNLLLLQNASVYAPRSFLRLGMKGHLKGKSYQIIGRISYSSQLKEFCFEDRIYYEEPWPYDTWTLLGEDGSYAWITEDAEGFALGETFVPDNPMVPSIKNNQASFLKDQRPRIVKEFSKSRVRYFEGEFTWQPKVDDVSRSGVYSYWGNEYEFSENLDQNGEVKEVEFFISKKIEELQLAQGFKAEEAIARILDGRKNKKMATKWAWLTAGLAFLMLVCGAIFQDISFTGKVREYAVSVKDLSGEGKIFGPVRLEKEGRLHRLVLKGRIPDNKSFEGGVELMDSSRLVINNLNGDFWRESGRDSDGRWSESNLRATSTFKLSKAGDYFFRIYSVKSPKNLPQLANSALKLEIYQGIIPGRFFYLSAIFLLFYGFTIWKFKTTNPLFVAPGMFVALAAIMGFSWFILKNMDDD